MTFEEIKKIKFNESICNDNSLVILGNCLDNLNKIDDNSIDLIFADPPYNIGKDFGNNKDKWNSTSEYIDWCKLWIDECFRVLKNNGTFYFMTATQFMPYLDVYVSENYLGPYSKLDTNLPNSPNLWSLGYAEGPELLTTNQGRLLYVDQVYNSESRVTQSYGVYKANDSELTKWSGFKLLVCDNGNTKMRHGSFMFNNLESSIPIPKEYFPKIERDSSLGTRVII